VNSYCSTTPPPPPPVSRTMASSSSASLKAIDALNFDNLVLRSLPVDPNPTNEQRDVRLEAHAHTHTHLCGCTFDPSSSTCESLSLSHSLVRCLERCSLAWHRFRSRIHVWSRSRLLRYCCSTSIPRKPNDPSSSSTLQAIGAWQRHATRQRVPLLFLR